MKTVFFFPNGNTAVCHGHNQVAHLQESWLRKFVQFLSDQGEDPEEYEFNLPDGRKAKWRDDNWTTI